LVETVAARKATGSPVEVKGFPPMVISKRPKTRESTIPLIAVTKPFSFTN
jgi:hypothetical protein